MTPTTTDYDFGIWPGYAESGGIDQGLLPFPIATISYYLETTSIGRVWFGGDDFPGLPAELVDVYFNVSAIRVIGTFQFGAAEVSIAWEIERGQTVTQEGDTEPTITGEVATRMDVDEGLNQDGFSGSYSNEDGSTFAFSLSPVPVYYEDSDDAKGWGLSFSASLFLREVTDEDNDGNDESATTIARWGVNEIVGAGYEWSAESGDVFGRSVPMLRSLGFQSDALGVYDDRLLEAAFSVDVLARFPD